MLSSKILPQGMGHTTCCFLQIEGGQENEKYFVIENAEEKKLPIGELVFNFFLWKIFLKDPIYVYFLP